MGCGGGGGGGGGLHNIQFVIKKFLSFFKDLNIIILFIDIFIFNANLGVC